MRSKRFKSVALFLVLAATRSGAGSTPDVPGPPPILASPIATLKSVAGMVNENKEAVVSPREFALFTDIAGGRAGRWSIADAALLASGVNNEEDRHYYL